MTDDSSTPALLFESSFLVSVLSPTAAGDLATVSSVLSGFCDPLLLEVWPSTTALSVSLPELTDANDTSSSCFFFFLEEGLGFLDDLASDGVDSDGDASPAGADSACVALLF